MTYGIELKGRSGWLLVSSDRSRDTALANGQHLANELGIRCRVVVYRPEFKLIDIFYPDDEE